MKRDTELTDVGAHDVQVAGALAERVAARFAPLPQVAAITLSGSLRSGGGDSASDVDIYVYGDGDALLEARHAIARDLAAPEAHIAIDERFWGPGDAWVDAATGINVDLIYFSPQWMEDQVARVLDRHEASVGYSTCFWHNVLTSRLLHDRDGWYAGLKQHAEQPYPDALRRAVFAMNYPILRNSPSSYRQQIDLAIRRRDRVSVSHRVAALLASYFDILFALNRAPHPGEKRLVQKASALSLLPARMAEQVETLIVGVGAPWEAQRTLEHVDALVDALDAVMPAEVDRSPGITGAER